MRWRVYIAIAAALIMVGLIGWSEASSFERSHEEREHRVMQERLAQLVDQWESHIIDRVTPWLSELVSEQDFAAREAVHRAGTPFFDAAYLWEGRDFTYPADAVTEDVPRLRADPCIAEAGRSAATLDPVELARRYERCFGVNRGVTLFAASEAAEAMLNSDQPIYAHELIRSIGPMSSTPLNLAALRGLPTRRLAELRLQQGRALNALGHDDLAEHLITALALDIATLDAPELDNVLDLYAWPIAHDLKAYGGPALGGEGDDLLGRAERRLSAWKEIKNRNWAARDVPTLADGPRVLVDPYGDPPWVLYVARLGIGDMIGAVQVDQPTLARWLMDRTRPSLRPHLSIRDVSGAVLAGAAGEASVEVAFTRALPHLRAVVTVGAESNSAATRRAAAAHLLPFGVAILLGMVALYGVIRSDLQLLKLLERQREFVARVTHELKTPLAGIRLMAETLEMGAYRDEAQREKFAQQIVKETERLALRVDEVIKSSTRPLVESSVSVDITAMVRDVGERWKTLFEQRGGALTVEASDARTMTGLPGLLRDALTNLLDNALKYRREDRPARATIRLRGDRRWITIEVEDNGMGVPPALRKSIFEKFRRVEGPGRGKSGGHGLGLAFVADAAREHRGSIECIGNASGGATFILRIRRRS